MGCFLVGGGQRGKRAAPEAAAQVQDSQKGRSKQFLKGYVRLKDTKPPFLPLPSKTKQLELDMSISMSFLHVYINILAV